MVEQNVATISRWRAAGGALIVGLGLFVFRSLSRQEYGVLEVVFGCTIAGTAFIASVRGDKVTFLAYLRR